MRSAFLTTLALFIAAPAAAQPKPQPGQAREKPLGRSARVSGKALIKLPGRGWDPLKVDRPLRTGDVVQAKKGTLEVVIGQGAEQGKAKQAYSGHRVILKAGGRLALRPVGSDRDAVLEEGEGFVFSLGKLRVRIGKTLLELGAADAELKAKKDGVGDVVIHQGTGRLATPTGKLELVAGDRVRIDARGRAKKSKTRLRLPKYVLSHESLVGVTKLVWKTDFRRWVQTPRFGATVDPAGPRGWDDHWLAPPTSRVDLREGIVRGLPGQVDTFAPEDELKKLAGRSTGPMEVRLGRGNAGMFPLPKGLRVRITYRVSLGTVHLRPRLKPDAADDRGEQYQVPVPSRTNLWTTLEVKLTGLIKGPVPNPVLTYLSIDGGQEGKKCTLEVKEIVAYVP